MMRMGLVAVMVLVTALGMGSGCGVTGPKVTFGRAGDGTVLQADGPGIEGNVTDPATGTVITSGGFYLNPGAGIAMVMRYVSGLFDKGGDAAKSVSGE